MQNFSDFYNTECCRIANPKKQMLTLEFTENWNGKLFTDHFNELTMYSPEYIKGFKMEVVLHNTGMGSLSMGIVKIEAVRALPFSRLSEIVSYLNLGKSLQFQAELLNRVHNEGKMLSPDTMVTHMVCGYIDRNIKNQTLVMKEWWQLKQLKQSA